MSTTDPTIPLAIGIVALALAVVMIALGLRKSRLKIERKRFLTKAELDMLAILRSVLPAHHISCQVSMGALLSPKKGLSTKEFWRTRNRFGQKITDFVVIDPDTGTVEAVIELDDASHDPKKDKERDALLAMGNYRVLRFPSKPCPTVEIVREKTVFLRDASQA